MEKPADFDGEITKEIVLKSFNRGLSDSNIIKRLFEEKMTTEARFEQAEDILWQLKDEGNNTFTLITSEYWMNKDEIIASEFEGECLLSATEA
jgi:ABC-type oligopeptide transport system substrate-binding subunit